MSKRTEGAIRTWNYLDEYTNEKKIILDAVDRVFSSGRLILGKNVETFEEEFSRYCCRKYGVGVNSGTDALFLALKALGIGDDDEVITVANTAVPTISAIVSTGASPRFVDIEENSYLIDPNRIKDAITKRTKCILPVHLYGQSADMKSINEIARKNNLFVVEDCAQATGAKFNDKIAGSMSDIAAFSFYPTKILGAYGDGGMVVTNNKFLYDKVRKLRFYGMKQRYYSLEHGYNSRLDELHAAILNSKLKNLCEYITRRKILAQRYFKTLQDTQLILPKILKNREHVFAIFACRHKRRATIINALQKDDIFVNIDYPYPIHTMPPYRRFFSAGQQNLNITERIAHEIFSLPMYPSLTFKTQDYVIQRLINVLSDIDDTKSAHP